MFTRAEIISLQSSALTSALFLRLHGIRDITLIPAMIFTNFSDASYDEVYGKALATIDHDEKHQLYGELQQILTDQAASVFIEDPADFIAVSNKYTGYQSDPVSAIDLSLVKPVQ